MLLYDVEQALGFRVVRFIVSLYKLRWLPLDEAGEGINNYKILVLKLAQWSPAIKLIYPSTV
jgi:hypothetical protein